MMTNRTCNVTGRRSPGRVKGLFHHHPKRRSAVNIGIAKASQLFMASRGRTEYHMKKVLSASFHSKPHGGKQYSRKNFPTSINYFVHFFGGGASTIQQQGYLNTAKKFGKSCELTYQYLH